MQSLLIFNPRCAFHLVLVTLFTATMMLHARTRSAFLNPPPSSCRLPPAFRMASGSGLQHIHPTASRMPSVERGFHCARLWAEQEGSRLLTKDQRLLTTSRWMSQSDDPRSSSGSTNETVPASSSAAESGSHLVDTSAHESEHDPKSPMDSSLEHKPGNHKALEELEERAKHAGFMEGAKQLSERLVGMIEKRTAQRSAERAGERLGERAAQRIGERVTERAGERAGERITERVGERVGERIAERAGERAGERIAERAGEHAGEALTSKFGESVVESAGKRMMERAGERAVERIVERAGEHTGERIVERAAEHLGESLAPKLGERLADLSGMRIFERTGERAGERFAERSAERLGESIAPRLGERVSESVGNQWIKRAGERSGKEIAERASERFSESVTSKAGERIIESASESVMLERAGEHAVASSVSHSMAAARASGRALMLRRVGRGVLIALPVLGGLFALFLLRQDMSRAIAEWRSRRVKFTPSLRFGNYSWVLFASASFADGLDAVCHFAIAYEACGGMMGHGHVSHLLEAISLTCAVISTVSAVGGEVLSTAQHPRETTGNENPPRVSR
jgi:hypothetical protein